MDPRQSVEFEPVALRRRRRRIDPAVIGAAVVVAAVLVAVVKPWGGTTADPANVDPSSAAEASSRPVASVASIDAATVVARPALAWSDVSAAIEPRDGWGIRAILAEPGPTSSDGGTTYSERWIAVHDGSDGYLPAVLSIGDRSLVAIGLTYPSGQAPLDVRIWRRSSTGTLYWVDARPVARDPAQGGLIFVPPPSDPGAPAWGAGDYRIDLLIGSGDIRHIDVAIPDRYENVRPSSVDPPQVAEVVTGSAADPSAVPPGLFATIDHVAVPMEAVSGPPLDEAAAWLDTEPGSGRAPEDRVAVESLPRATGLGVRLPDGSRVRSASFERLAPGPMRNPPTPLGGGIIDRRDADPWVVFAARRGDAWAPGVYRIDVTWSDAAGLHDGSWHIELRPGPYTGPPPLLALARSWARHAGTSGLVVGRAEPLEGGPRSSAIRLLPLVDPDGTPGTIPADALCEGTVVDGTPAAFGLAHPVDEPLAVTRVTWVDATLRGMGELTTLQATDVVPGLTLIAPTDGASFLPGIYRIGIRDGQGDRTYALCVDVPGTAGG